MYLVRMNFVVLFVAIFSPILFGQQQENISFKNGKSIAVDGIIGSEEWSDSDSLLIPITESWSIKVKYKHDGENLLFRFSGLKSPVRIMGIPFRFPEIIIQTGEEATSWNENTWWFHVSATDCESNVKVDDYTNCKAEGINWEANNFQQMMQGDIVIEMKMPFSKIKLNTEQKNTFKISFRMNDTMGNKTFFPSDTDEKNPTTWLNGNIIN